MRNARTLLLCLLHFKNVDLFLNAFIQYASFGLFGVYVQLDEVEGFYAQINHPNICPLLHVNPKP